MPRPILLLDSGIGGLTILRAVRQQLPAHDYIYLADWANFPYGGRTQTELVARLQQLVSRCIDEFDPQLVVIACNTASTAVLPALRQRWPQLPFVGVVPAIKPAAKLTQTGTIAVLATAGTVTNGYTESLCKEFAPQCDVALIAAPALVTMAEAHMARNVVALELAEVAHAVRERAPAADTCVLACTHFPILIGPLASALPEIQHWVDSSAAIARRVAQLATPHTEPLSVGKVTLICTAPPQVSQLNHEWRSALALPELSWQMLY